MNMISRNVAPRPIKMWINGKCFNVNPFGKRGSKKKKSNNGEINCNMEKTEIQAENFHPIFEENGKFSTKFRVPELYYKKLLQVPEFSLKDLSEKTKSEIILPKSKDEEHILVNSDSKDNLYKTVDELHSVIAHIRKKSLALQFLCIPCKNEGIRERFENLKKEILSIETIEGMHESIFMAPEKLHLTINVFALLDENEKMEAINSLHDYMEKTLEPVFKKIGPVSIEISGLDCMNNNIKKVDVLYAKAKMIQKHEEHSLQSIVNGCSNHFYNKGFLKEPQDEVKLHMTVINTKYRKIPNISRRKRPKRTSIDATTIMDKYKDYSFGTFTFDSIHLSYITLKGEDGFYKPLTIAKINY